MVRLLLIIGLLLAGTSAWASKPLAAWWAKPDTLGLRYQDLTLRTSDHVRLAAWLIEPAAAVPDRRTTVVVAGGDWGNMSYSLYLAQALSAAGYRVLLFDYRGFGHSQAFAIDINQLYYAEFATDLGTALAEARRRAPGQRVGIHGFSMGALLGARVAARDAAKGAAGARCDFLITEGFPANPPAIVAYNRRTTPERPTTLPADAATFGRVAARVGCPWLLFAGRADPITTLAQAEATVRAARPG